MKFINTFLLTLLVALHSILPAFAAETSVTPVPIPPTPVPPGTIQKLPIGSVKELWMWAGEQVVRSSASAWSPTSAGGKGDSYFARLITNGLDLIEATNWLSKLPITLGVFNPNDRVSTFASFEDSTGFSMFYGDSQNYMSYNAGTTGFVVRAHVKIRMNDHIPLPACGVHWASIIERDDYGNVLSWNDVRVLRASDYGGACDRIFFPAFFAGKKGDLVTHYDDGRMAVLDLESGDVRQLRNAAVQMTANFLGGFGLRDTNAVYVGVSDDDHIANRATIVQLTLTQTTMVRFASWLPTSERAYMVSIRTKSTAAVNRYAIPMSTGFIEVQLPAGKYWIDFSFPSGFGEEENEYGRPYNGGEKG